MAPPHAPHHTPHTTGGAHWAAPAQAARNKHTGEKVAIKHIDRVFADKADTVRIIRELRFLRLLKHPNIIGVVDVLLPQQRTSFDDIYIVFELLDTDLAHMIRSKTKYDETHRQWLIYQLLAGLKHIHGANVFHRDLKPGNVLLNADCDLKICDFGLARCNFPDQKHAVFWTDYVATRWYRAPELICSYYTKYTTAIDIWSVGCIFAELMRRKPLFPGHNVYHQLDLITDLLGKPTDEEIDKVRSDKARDYLKSLQYKPPRDLTPLFPGVDPLAIDLLGRMLTFDPDKRITGQEALQHAYFAKFRGMAMPSEVPPTMMAEEFAWETQDRSLSVARLREILFTEIEAYHPELASMSYAPSAGLQVRDQIQALDRGDKPSAGAMSMPAAATRPLYESAERMAAQGQIPIPGGQAVGGGGGGGGDDMMDGMMDGDLQGDAGEFDMMGGGEDMSLDEQPALPQTMSAADMAKLAQASSAAQLDPNVRFSIAVQAAASAASVAAMLRLLWLSSWCYRYSRQWYTARPTH